MKFNSFKDFINEILDVPKLIIRLWIVLWLCLLILLIMKFCFNIWYPVVIENEYLARFSEYASNSFLKYILLSIVYLINANFIYLIACRKFRYSKLLECILMNIFFGTTFIVKCLNMYIAYGLEIVYSIIVPMIYLYKYRQEYHKLKAFLYLVIMQIIVFVFQLNILLVRGLPMNLLDTNVIIQILLQLDYYIFLSVIWIGVGYMGLAGIWIFINDVTKLKSIKELELAKAHPNTKTVKAIDRKIAKLEAVK